MADRQFAIWCAVHLRLSAMRHEVGFKLFTGALSPYYVEPWMSERLFGVTLASIYYEIVGNAMEDMRAH